MRNNHGRIQGRAGVELRKRRLALFPLCRMCSDKGIATEATTVDHIIPLSQGGEDTDNNCQSLCDDCHSFKTASEDYASVNHPDWLEPSAIPLTIVSGPPCSGKTTYIKDRAKPADTVIDLDGIMMRLAPNYRHWSGALDRSLFNKAVRARNAMLGSLKDKTEGQAWFIVSAPTKAERDWWQGKLGGETVLLHPGTDECKKRAIERGTPNAVKGVEAWELAAKKPWIAPATKAPKQKTGLDGWPVE